MPILKRLEDQDWSVRHQLAASIGLMPAASRDPAIVSLLERYGDDPITVDATLSGVRGGEAAPRASAAGEPDVYAAARRGCRDARRDAGSQRS